jgi:5-formyltetrahydrofolate cyclo-ligase
MAEDRKYPIRELMRHARAALPKAQALALSDSIQSHALQLPPYRAARAVALYAALGKEVDTARLARQALADGRRLFYPRLEPEGHGMRMLEVHATEDLQPGPLGIRQPAAGAELEPDMLRHTVIFVPGVAFSWRGQRLGRGGGFYDRYLASHPSRLATVGLAYASQVLEELPEDHWDQGVDWIVTEHGIRAVARAPGT